jgi:hypothetical protein
VSVAECAALTTPIVYFLEDAMKKVVGSLSLTLLLLPNLAAASPITFNLRDPFIETIDEVNSFPLTIDGLTATLTALPTTFNEPPLRNLLLNQTASSFGINVDNTTCGGDEESDQLDGGCTNESIRIVFNHGVILNSFRVSSFGAADLGLVTIGAITIPIISTGSHPLGGLFLAAGDPWSVAFTAGNGFSLDDFVVTDTVPEPTSLLLLGTGMAWLIVTTRRRRKPQAQA